MTQDQGQIIRDIQKEIIAFKREMPNYPDHITARAAFVSKYSGQLSSMSIIWKYERPNDIDARKDIISDMKRSAIQTIAAAMLFIQNLPNPENTK